MSVARDPTLLLIGAAGADELRERLDAFEAGETSEDAQGAPDMPLRAAVIARDSDSLAARVAELRRWLDDGSDPDGLRASRGLFLGAGRARPRIGFLFPGQGAPVYTDAGAIGARFPAAARIFDHAELPRRREDVPRERVQVSVVASTLAALVAMDELGIEAELGVSHSMGELGALHWAGAMDEAAALSIAYAGETVITHASADGTMATVLGDEETFQRVVESTGVAAAAFNSPTQRVVSGTVEEIERAVSHARELGARVVPLRVTGAYHTPEMLDAIRELQAHLETVPIRALQRRVISAVIGTTVPQDMSLRELMARQFCEPVRFMEAASEAARDADLLIEVGPGKMLAGLVAEFTDTPAIATRAGTKSAYGLFEVAAAAYAAGAPVRVEALRPASGRTASPSAATA